jgi:hypothetical protein
MEIGSYEEAIAAAWTDIGYANRSEGKCRALRVTMAGKVGASKKVGLMRFLSRNFAGHRSNERDSHNTVGFSALVPGNAQSANG